MKPSRASRARAESVNTAGWAGRRRAREAVRPGGPETLEIRKVPIPPVREGWSLIQVKGVGSNRSELRTRQGHSPNVTFPRVLGIECVGIVAASTDPGLPEGTSRRGGDG
ncbi:alcohol dehydrogenase catalytic domain-containing protein [Nocardia niwae]|uniref:alcohol dehydrogenase catalytic domain-containing protein n=1 Tax=Nocardia niwae TaxID=626084 RepID=UPI003F4D6DC2